MTSSCSQVDLFEGNGAAVQRTKLEAIELGSADACLPHGAKNLCKDGSAAMLVVRNLAGVVLAVFEQKEALRDVLTRLTELLGAVSQVVELVGQDARRVTCDEELWASREAAAVCMGVRVECAWCREPLHCGCRAASYEDCPCVEGPSQSFCADCQRTLNRIARLEADDAPEELRWCSTEDDEPEIWNREEDDF